jgi:uncharacterized protein YdeI (YjbR/CyaY-like superfamily)
VPTPTNLRFFETAADLRKWFRANGTSADELWVGFYRKDSGRKSITWPEAFDEALCVGWIDGIRKKLDETSFTNRFTPRRKGSTWSAVNIARVKALSKAKRMRPEGLAAFAARKVFKSGIYSYEQRPQTLPEPYAGLLRKHARAWAFFEAQPPGYRKLATWFIVSAKQDDTRLKRFQRLLEACARGERLR